MADSLLIAALALQHNPWRANMYLSAATAVGAAGIIPFDTVIYDPNGNLVTGASAKYNVPVDGYYAIIFEGQVTTAAVAYGEVAVTGTVTGFSTGGAAAVANQLVVGQW